MKRALGGAYQFVEDESKDRWILARPSDFVEEEK